MTAICADCGHELHIGDWPYCPHGAATHFTVVPDAIPGGVVIENLTPQPKRYYSRTEIKDEMRARGVEQKVRHVGAPGSDKSKHTQRWV